MHGQKNIKHQTTSVIILYNCVCSLQGKNKTGSGV